MVAEYFLDLGSCWPEDHSQKPADICIAYAADAAVFGFLAGGSLDVQPLERLR